MHDREGLEKMALERVSAELYYELLDCLDTTTNAQLLTIIETSNI